MTSPDDGSFLAGLTPQERADLLRRGFSREWGGAETLFGEGEEKRDHILVDDVAALTSAALQHRSKGVLNIATGRSASFREAAEMVVALSPRPVEIRGTPRQNPITHRHFDITDCLKAFPEFHYVPLRDGLARAAKEGA